MKNIHILATPNPSRLAILGMSNTLQLFDNLITFKTFGRSPQNIYITNDEIVTEYSQGLYFIDVYTGSSHVFSPIYVNKETIAAGKFHTYMNNGNMCKKIIMTTDPQLIANGVQAIDDDFLEWFVKNPSCEFVEVDRDEREVGNHLGGVVTEYGDYKIIIPKEESKKELEKEMFELEQELDIPSNLRWHNSEPKKRLEKYSERFDNKDNEVVKGVFNPENWGKRLVKEEPDYTALLKPVGTWQENYLEEYFLGKMKEVLLFGNDAQAIRFMEKYYEVKKEQDEK